MILIYVVDFQTPPTTLPPDQWEYTPPPVIRTTPATGYHCLFASCSNKNTGSYIIKFDFEFRCNLSCNIASLHLQTASTLCASFLCYKYIIHCHYCFFLVICFETSDPLCIGFVEPPSGLPNAIGGKSWQHSKEMLTALLKMEDHNCYSDLPLFACTTSFPECRAGRLKYPCRSFCLG